MSMTVMKISRKNLNRKIFRTGKFYMENVPPHITSCGTVVYSSLPSFESEREAYEIASLSVSLCVPH
jgi:hypothetical protein